MAYFVTHREDLEQ